MTTSLTAAQKHVVQLAAGEYFTVAGQCEVLIEYSGRSRLRKLGSADTESVGPYAVPAMITVIAAGAVTISAPTLYVLPAAGLTSPQVSGIQSVVLDGGTPRSSQAINLQLFNTASAVSNNSGLSVVGDANGGLVAAVDNVAGTGYISLPFALKASVNWLFACKISIGDARNVIVQVCNEAQDSWSGYTLTASSAGISGSILGNQTFPNAMGGASTIPEGTEVWMVLCNNDGNVTVSVFCPALYTSVVFDSSPSQGPLTDWQINKFAVNGQSSGNYCFGDTTQPQNYLTRVKISTASTASKILSVYALDGLAVPEAGTLFPMIYRPTVANESDVPVFIPANFRASTGKGVLVNHPANNPGNPKNYNALETVLHLQRNGYVCIAPTGADVPTDFTNFTSTNVGAPTGLRYRHLNVQYLRTLFPNIYWMGALGCSMGGVNSLIHEMTYPGTFGAIANVSAVGDLVATFNLAVAFQNLIQKGFGKVFLCIQAGTGQAPESSPTYWQQISFDKIAPDDIYYTSSTYNWKTLYAAGTTYALNDIVVVQSTLGAVHFNNFNPPSNAGLLKNVPIALWHGDADTTIPVSQSANLAAALTAAGNPNVTFTNIAGGTHLGATVYDKNAILQHFNLWSR